jgi:ATP-dependent DNA helicase RecQ
VLLLPGPDDKDIWAYFASASMPQQEQADAVLRALAEASRPLSTVALEAMVDIRRTRLELLLKVLDVDGAVRRVSGGWTSTGEPWTYDAERYARVSQARVREQELMVAYEQTDTCRMAFLQEALDDDTAQPCGRCDSCAGPWFPSEIPDVALTTARGRLERAGVELEPRAQWPSGMDRLGVPLKGKIAADEAMSTGRAVARLTDLGWGQQLRTLLREPDAAAPEALLQACIPILRDWDWSERPVAVVTVPSRRRPQLVESVGRGIAQLGRLEWLGPLEPVEGGPVGEAGGNSAFRLAGVWGRLTAGSALGDRLRALDGPVLLVDDVASSRWTLTVAAQAIRQAGAATVLPFVLAIDG